MKRGEAIHQMGMAETSRRTTTRTVRRRFHFTGSRMESGSKVLAQSLTRIYAKVRAELPVAVSLAFRDGAGVDLVAARLDSDTDGNLADVLPHHVELPFVGRGEGA